MRLRTVVPLAGLVGLVGLLVGIASGCSDADDPIGAPTSAAVVEAGDRPGSDEPEHAASPADHVAGATGLGDPYGPDLGNGGYDVDHYDLDLSWEPTLLRLDGTAVVTAEATEGLRAFNLDLDGLEVTSVQVDGEAAEWSRSGRELTVVPATSIDEGDDFDVEVVYGGTPGQAQHPGAPGPLGWLTTAAGESYVLSEPNGAATWFPANDHPSDKATVSVTASVPEGWTAVSNGLLVDQQTDAGRSTFSWESSDPMTPYLVTLATGDFEVEEYVTDGGLPIRNYFPRGMMAEGSYDHGRIAEMVDFFEARFGPYPFEAYGVVVVPEILELALETQTISTFGIDSIPGDRSAEWVAAHELAHQWFGNSVSLSRWEDIWLNEGLTTYAHLLWQEHSDPNFSVDAELARIVAEGPLAPPADPGPAELFGTPVYFRGAMVMHALRAELGDEVFFEVLRTWTDRYRHGNATTAEFISLTKEVVAEATVSGESGAGGGAGSDSDADLDAFFDAWLYAPTAPPLPTN